jgi:hypothetical protein
VVLMTFFLLSFAFVGNADEMVPTTAAQVPVYRFQTLGDFLHTPAVLLMVPCSVLLAMKLQLKKNTFINQPGPSMGYNMH